MESAPSWHPRRLALVRGHTCDHAGPVFCSDHDFLWRMHCQPAELGRMGIFNRSYSEKVLIARVHREFLARPRLSMGLAAGAGLWRERARFITEIQELIKIRAELAK